MGSNPYLQGAAVTFQTSRPSDLPDFKNPPLVECALGVQFETPSGYHQIHAGQVWEKFKLDYPEVQTVEPLPPTFEVFGVAGAGQQLGAQIQFTSGVVHPRYWFCSSDRQQLIQFQNDRLLFNWRKVGLDTPYPRYESLKSKFAACSSQVELALRELSLGPSLCVNQCEITYINQVRFEDFESTSASRLFSFLQFSDASPDDFACTFRHVVNDAGGRPYARLTCEVVPLFQSDGRPLIQLSLVFRGRPKTPTLESSLEFFDAGRSEIVRRFTSMTTSAAHAIWGRTQ